MAEIITEPLRNWVISNVQAGYGPEALLASMRQAGWQGSAAESVLEQVLNDHLKSATRSSPVVDVPPPLNTPGIAATPAQVAGHKLPSIDLSGSPRTIDVGGRSIKILTDLQHPRVVVLGDFLSQGECDALIALARPRIKRSTTIIDDTGGEQVHQDRTSSGMFFQRGETALIQRIEARIASLTHWPIEYGEGLQILNYKVGAEYKPHFDYFDPKLPGTPTLLTRGGQRLATLVMYLNNPAQGGGTSFPDAGLMVRPQKGGAVFFSYATPEESTLTRHGGDPVLKGEKWVATKWLRQGVFA